MEINQWQAVVYSLIRIGWIVVQSKAGTWLTKPRSRQNRVIVSSRTLDLFVRNGILEKKSDNGDVVIYAKPSLNL